LVQAIERLVVDVAGQDVDALGFNGSAARCMLVKMARQGDLS
jgi:hypothetical protein